MKKRLLALIAVALLLIVMATVLFSNIGAIDDKYLSNYADMDAVQEWIKVNVTDAATPPVLFTVGGSVRSDSLTWTKDVSKTTTVVDYPDNDPKERNYYTITYFNEDYKLEVKMTFTTYPNYPVIEHCAYLTYKGTGVSPVISGLYSLSDELLEDNTHEYHMHYSTGCNAGLPEYLGDFSHDYNLYDEVFTSSEKVVQVVNGKSTSTYLPYFNIEDKTANRGVISVLSWQGNWDAAWVKTGVGAYMCASLSSSMNCQIYPEESIKYPTMLLLFYKGDWLNGQNVYRRWSYDHNLLRNSTKKHMTTQNVYLCTGPITPGLIDAQTDIASDLAALREYHNSGLDGYCTYWVTDAGWYDYRDKTSWFDCTGNYYYNDRTRYPNGIKEFSDALHKDGIMFSLWIEPERIMAGTDMYNDLTAKKHYSAYNPSIEISPFLHNNAEASLLTNYSEPEIVDFTVDVVDSILKLSGVDVYRQDFNTCPAPFWAQNDADMEKATGIKRTGLTENHYCQGYLSFMQQVAERNPGMMFDICASGGMRYDLESERYGYILTRSDMYHGFTWDNVTYSDAAVCQNLTYVMSLWHVGTAGFSTDNSSPLNALSNVTAYCGYGIAGSVPGGGIEAFCSTFKYWYEVSKYATGDYYPLSEYGGIKSSNNVIFQFNDPKTSSGTLVFLARTAGVLNAVPRDIDTSAQYTYYFVGDKDKTYNINGADLADGFSLTLAANEGKAIIYSKK